MFGFGKKKAIERIHEKWFEEIRPAFDDNDPRFGMAKLKAADFQGYVSRKNGAIEMLAGRLADRGNEFSPSLRERIQKFIQDEKSKLAAEINARR